MRRAILLNNIDSFIDFVKQGNIVLFPTDTVWGIGVFVEEEDRIEKIFEIKKRNKNKKLPILAGNKNYIYDNFYTSEKERLIIEHFMPGSLTIILKPIKIYPSLVMHEDTVAVRIPNCKDLQYVLSLYPIAATSANISGMNPINNVDKIIEIFGNYHVGIVNFDMCYPKGFSSTIIKFVNNELQILREGDIRREDIEEVIFNDRYE